VKMSFANKLSRSIARKILSVGLLAGVLLFSSIPANAQSSTNIPAWELRQLMLGYSEALQVCGGADSGVQSRLAELDREQLEVFSAGVSDSSGFRQALLNVISSCNDLSANVSSQALEVSAQALTPPNDASFPPAYPSGGGYDAFTATLPLVNGPTNRSDESWLGALWISHDTLVVVAIGLQGLCDVAPSGDILLANVVACIPQVIAWEAAQGTQIAINQAGYHDGLIDGAEIEAAYENSKRLIGNAVDISNDLTAHDIAISNQIVQHDIAITNQISQHDTDIKARLDVLNGKLDVMMARQLELIRLINTPSGRRATDVPACDGGPCDWPNR
jgi:hypothetical protein